MKAHLVQANLDTMCPTTHLYACDDGKYLLVTAKSEVALADLARSLGIPIRAHQCGEGVEVFLSDERGRVIDADGDPANGLTALLKLPAGTHIDGLLAAGYEYEGTNPND